MKEFNLDNKLDRFLNKLESKYEWFYIEYMSGSVYVFKHTKSRLIYCTPFWEDEDNIPIDISKGYGTEFFYKIEYKRPTNKEEFKAFKKFYKRLIKELKRTIKK